jgi:tRNA-splicing ligase RtcB
MVGRLGAYLFGVRDGAVGDRRVDRHPLVQKSPTEWHIELRDGMRVPGIILATEELIQTMDKQVSQQLAQVATLPGIVKAAYAMPDASGGYGFPKGGATAFDPEEGGVVAGGGAGFDMGWGTRTLRTGLTVAQILPHREALADRLCATVLAGGGARLLRLTPRGMDAMLLGGARWAVAMGYGSTADLEWIEEQGCMAGADPGCVSELAKTRQRDEMGTLGAGNDYLGMQRVAQIYDPWVAKVLGIHLDDIKVSIHCGSRGLGRQIGADYGKPMATAASRHGIALSNRDLVCAPLDSEVGRRYLGAMRASVNCALANRQILAHRVRQAFNRIFPEARLEVLYDVSYNTCRSETHVVDSRARALYVHRKGASRALGPGHPDLPPAWREIGQPSLVGGAMNTASYIMIGTSSSLEQAFGSSCHGRGPVSNPHRTIYPQRTLESQDVLMRLGVLIRSPSQRGVMVAEQPDAHQDAGVVVEAAEQAGLARRVARLEPLICVKG